MLTEILASLGLTPEQTDLYQSLISHGGQSAAQLSKTTSVKRTYVYRVAQELVAKGLITMSKKARGTVFSAASPDQLLVAAEQQKQAAAQAQIALEGLLPSLKSQFQAVAEKPVISYFEGVEGIKRVYADTLREGKPIYALVLPVEMDPQILTYLQKSYRIERAKLGIHASVIAAANKYGTDYQLGDTQFDRTTLLVPEDKFPFQHEIDIYGDKVAFINYKKNAPLLGIVIANPQIAKTMKAFFDLAWEAADKIYKK